MARGLLQKSGNIFLKSPFIALLTRLLAYTRGGKYLRDFRVNGGNTVIPML
jgi:hypothetical protein